jgi:hypothetical protein
MGIGDVRNVDQRAFQLVAVKGFAARAVHQRTRELRRQFLAARPHRVFPRSPVPIVPLRLKVCISAVGQEHL